MQCQWMIWCRTRTKEKALRLQRRVVEQLDCEATSLTIAVDEDIPGFDVRFETEINANNWADAIFAAVVSGQKLGDYWIICGDARNTLSVFSDDILIPGVRRCEWTLVRKSELIHG